VLQPCGPAKERTRGFYLPGDLIGLDAFESGHFPSSTAALEPSQVCAVPVAELRRAMHFEPT
jgi:CRP/FNR family transcriptional regulator, anaerobic regulatory protein